MATNQQTINLGSVQAPFLQATITLPANGTRIFDYVYDAFHLYSASTEGILEVTFGGAAVQSKFGSGMGYKLKEPVSYIQFFNPSNSPLTITFIVAIGEIIDSRLSISGNVFVLPAVGAVFETKKAGFTNYTAGTTSGNSTINYGANSQIDVLCTSGSITVDNAAGVTLTLTAGQSWGTCLATAGTLTFTGTGSYNYSVGDWN